MDEKILLLLLVMTRRYFFEKIREIKTEEKMMKNKEEKTLLILQLHTKKNITTCAPVQLQNELQKKKKIEKTVPQQP
jgi:hypothetical protein